MQTTFCFHFLKIIKKLWNESNFVFSVLKDYKNTKPKKLEGIDEYMLQKLQETTEKIRKLYENYNIAEARKNIEIFFWHDFCNNYLEIVKNRVYNEKGQKKESAQYVLYQTLLAILKMMSPITCFITEELYQDYFKKFEKDKSIHISFWPDMKIKQDKKIEEAGDLFIEILQKVRQEKTQKQKSMKAEIILTIDKKDKEKLHEMLQDLKAVVNAREIKEGRFKVEFI